MKTALKNIYWIDINWIDEQIKKTEIIKDKWQFPNEIWIEANAIIMVYNYIKAQLKPITPLIEDSWYNGSERGDNGYGNANKIETYINIKQFE